MNIGFPEAKNSVAALGKVGIARTVTLSIGFLDRVQAGIFGRVGVPEIAIPLDNYEMHREQRVHNKLSADDLLFLVERADTCKNVATGSLKAIGFLVCRKAQNTIDTLCIFFGIATCPDAILGIAGSQFPSSRIERFATGGAPQHFPTSTNIYRALMRLLFRFLRGLPCVRAFQRTKAPSSTRMLHIKRWFAAPKAVSCTAFHTGFLMAGTWLIRLAADRADFRLRLVVHDVIIPWGFALCN